MKIELPITVKDKGLTDNQLVLIAFLYKLRQMYKTEWYCIYKYDIGTILQVNRTCHPLKMFEGLTPYLTARYSSDYKMDIALKQWTEETFEYQLQDFRNVIVWSLLLDNSGYLETSKSEPANGLKLNAAPYKRHIAAALNIHYMDYGRIRLRK